MSAGPRALSSRAHKAGADAGERSGASWGRMGVAMLAALGFHLIGLGCLREFGGGRHGLRPRAEQYVYVTLASSGDAGKSRPALPRTSPVSSAALRHAAKALRRMITRKAAVATGSRLAAPSPALATREAAARSAPRAATDRPAGESGPATARVGAGGDSESGGSRSSAAEQGTFAADQVDEPPVPIATPLPQYPARARELGIEGRVVLRIIVDRRGAVEPDVKVVESIPLLEAAAVAAVRGWRFRPGRGRDGAPVRVWLEVPLRFALTPGE